MSTKKTTVPTVQQSSDPTKVVEKPVLAQAIVDISRAAQRLSQSGLNKKSVAVLIHYHSKVPLRDVEIVMSNIEWLERNCCQ